VRDELLAGARIPHPDGGVFGVERRRKMTVGEMGCYGHIIGYYWVVDGSVEIFKKIYSVLLLPVSLSCAPFPWASS
jgi:hypothetical protein